jgi:biopolymer transport protein ExbD
MAVRAEPNVTPMIDVMLVLLIIFMVVGPTLVDGFHAVPPEARYANRHPDEPGQVVVGSTAEAACSSTRWRSIPRDFVSGSARNSASIRKTA